MQPEVDTLTALQVAEGDAWQVGVVEEPRPAWFGLFGDETVAAQEVVGQVGAEPTARTCALSVALTTRHESTLSTSPEHSRVRSKRAEARLLLLLEPDVRISRIRLSISLLLQGTREELTALTGLQVEQPVAFQSGVDLALPKRLTTPLAPCFALQPSFHRSRETSFRNRAWLAQAGRPSLDRNVTDVWLLGSTGVTPLREPGGVRRYYEPLRLPTAAARQVMDSLPALSSRLAPWTPRRVSQVPEFISRRALSPITPDGSTGAFARCFSADSRFRHLRQVDRRH